MASGKLQTLCYKEEIESALRTPGLGGFQLLDLHDFPGQGTALIGVLDPFWDSKPYVTPTEFRRFCGKTVPLARLKQRVFTPGEPLQAGVEMAHFGSWDLSHAVVTWKIISNKNQVVDAGQWPPRTIAAGRLNTVGEIDAALSTVVPPRKLELVVGVDGTDIENDWDVWVYPHSVELEASGRVVVTASLIMFRGTNCEPAGRSCCCRIRNGFGATWRLVSRVSSGTRPGRAARRHTRWVSSAIHSTQHWPRFRLSIIATGNGGNWSAVPAQWYWMTCHRSCGRSCK